ncbi:MULTISPECIES: Lrp/AsnC family transcriptional regulator [Bordetella]|uniref:siroheme decarboxylase n=1 Tax=Bordetella genomosp. 7 TaxID=1416805 RepID=A0A261QXF3_9BORD|nr:MULTISPECIES: Lrp/AsnC family transcriptional regulator [Bordetella]OZI17207.1 AsnC family protein [Bordetella genomosp. 7]
MPPACDKPLDGLALAAANMYQRDMPLCARPYLAMAQQLGCTERALLDCLQELKQNGVLSRIGPVFNHQQAGASTLAALSVPPWDVDTIAAHISRYPEVNHNYLRSHRRNLWFVITAPDRAHIDRILADIAASTGLEPLDLPMVRAFRVDLGFSLQAQT